MSNDVVPAIELLAPARTVLTIGAFDGVHIGHQRLLELSKQSAADNQARVVAITFDPLPGELFRPDKFMGRILTNVRRRELLWEYGADSIVELQFTREMANQSAEAFVDQLISIGPVTDIWVGDDFALGHNREGTPERIRQLLHGHGTTVHAIARISHDGHEVSSSAIRSHLANGRAKEAHQLMGHYFQVRGPVVHGAQLGRQIGFPTANVAPPKGIVPIHDGIYASYAFVGDGLERLPAMTYIGTRPAVNTGERMIETHILDFEDDLYGQQLTTEFIDHLRPDSDFPSLEALIKQLGKDELAARAILGI